MKKYQKVLIATSILMAGTATGAKYYSDYQKNNINIVAVEDKEIKSNNKEMKDKGAIFEKADIADAIAEKNDDELKADTLNNEIELGAVKEETKEVIKEVEKETAKEEIKEVAKGVAREEIKEETKETVKEESIKVENSKGQAVESMGVREDVGGIYSAFAVEPTITVIPNDGSSYLTNKDEGVLVAVKYTGSGEKKIKIGDAAEKTLSTTATQNSDYQYILRVKDNVSITATTGSSTATKDINNFVKISTGCDMGTEGYVKDKTYYSAVLGATISNSQSTSFTSTNTKEVGIRYWRGDMDTEIYTVNTSNITAGSTGIISNSGGTLKYELQASSLKGNTTYYMQAYMVNSANEILLGDIKEFSTLKLPGVATGRGLYGLYYANNGDTTPKLIKHETGDRMTVSVPSGYSKVRWLGEISPLNSGTIKFRVTSAGGGTIKINGETLSFGSGTQEIRTSEIYEIEKNYPIEIIANSTSNKLFKLEWLEDLNYQEIHKEQLYAKEYVKMVSAVINSKGTDSQETNLSTGENINKKVITNGRVLNKISFNGTLTTAPTQATITKTAGGSETFNITGSKTANVEAWLVYLHNQVIEPLTENVKEIDYTTNKVTLKSGSVWDLYTDVVVVGRIMKLSDRKVYDLGRYITNATNRKLSDGKTLSEEQLYKADEVDNTYILNIYDGLETNEAYQEILNEYSTMERFVEDSKDVGRWNLGIGEARLFSVVPLRILLSFDGDSTFDMKNPVIQIPKKLYRNKECTTADTVFKLSMPTDARDSGSTNKITSLYYGDWRYFGTSGSTGYKENSTVANSSGTLDSAKGGTVSIEETDTHFNITLNGYTATNTLQSEKENNNIMLNVLLRVDSIDNKTSNEVFSGIADKLLNNSYRTYMNAKVLNTNSSGITTKVGEIPIEMKIKEQVSFE